MTSDQYTILPMKDVPYYEDTQKRTFKQKVVKIKNTICQQMAYSCPNNRLRIMFQRWRGVHIGNHVYLGVHCFLDNLHPEYIYIEDNASVNAETMILTHFNPMQQHRNILQAHVAPVLIKKGALVAVRTTILPNVCIGINSITSAGSVIDKSVPDYTLVQGNPAKVKMQFEALIQHD